MTTTPIDAMFQALADGDVDAARATCTPDARIWHGYDGVAMTLDQIGALWQGLIDGTARRYLADVRRRETADGYVQQHLFVVVAKDGSRKAWPVCVVVRIEDGRIARLDEYIDRAGAFVPEGDTPMTPGF